MEIGVIFATLLLLFVLFITIRLILGPLKILTHLFINCGIAVVILIIVNIIGGYLQFHIPVNPVSVISIGVLGVPGFILVSFLSFLFI